MAINWGLALGKALESGLNTYERLGEEELRQMQREKLRQEMQEQKALDTKFAETYGRVGQKNDYTEALQTADTGIGSQQAKMLSDQAAGFGPEGEKASAQAAAGALRENIGVKSALPDLTAGEYTNRQAMGDYTKAAAGVSRKGYVEALGLKKESRASDLDDEFDLKRSTLNKDLALARGTWESKGMQGLSELANKNGLKTEFVPGKDGIGKINVLGPKGDVLQTFTNGEDALKALEKAAYGKFQDSAVSLLGGPDKLLTYLNQREELSIKRENLDIERQYKGTGGVVDRAYNAKSTPKDNFRQEGVKAYFDELKNLDPTAKDFAARLRQLQDKYAGVLKDANSPGTTQNLADQVGKNLDADKSKKPEKAIETEKKPSYVPPEGSPAAKAAENRKKVALETEEKSRAGRERRQAFIAEKSAIDIRDLPAAFEKDKKTLSKPELIKKYGKGGRGLTDDQVVYLNS